MSKAEATNDFCTRCFKYSKCSKVQSECTMADSYQEGYEIRDIYDLAYNLRFPHKKQKEFFEEVLKRFKKERKEK